MLSIKKGLIYLIHSFIHSYSRYIQMLSTNCEKVHRNWKYIYKQNIFGKKYQQGFHFDSVKLISRRCFTTTSGGDWRGNNILRLPLQFLKSNDLRCFDPQTHQRTDISFDSIDGKPLYQVKVDNNGNIDGEIKLKSVTLNENGDGYEVEWEDGHCSKFGLKWVETQLQRFQKPKKPQQRLKNFTVPVPLNDVSKVIPRLPWSNLKENDIRSAEQFHKIRFTFSDVVTSNSDAIERAVQSLYQYGILFITSTPIDDGGAGVAALASALSGPSDKSSPETTLLAHYLENRGKEYKKQNLSTILKNGTDGPQRTLFGNVWFTNASSMTDGASTADSAYGNEALPLHTDFTYTQCPPGLQIFTMVSAADVGGESVFADGLAVAEYMRSNHEQEFDTLCRVHRRYRSVDEQTGWYLEGRGPVIEAIDTWQGLSTPPRLNDSRWGAVVRIRHNDLDRLPDLPSPHYEKDDIKSFYDELERAHEVWDSLLARDEFRLVVKLEPRDTVVVANQRCLHGRFSFKSSNSPRSLIGCYVSQEDLESRFRWMMKGNCTF